MRAAAAGAARTATHRRHRAWTSPSASVSKRTCAHHAAELSESRDVLALAMRGGVDGRVVAQRGDQRGVVEPRARGNRRPGTGQLQPDRGGVLRARPPRGPAGGAQGRGRGGGRRSDYIVEFRFRHASGEWRWMEGRGRAVYDGRRHAAHPVRHRHRHHHPQAGRNGAARRAKRRPNPPTSSRISSWPRCRTSFARRSTPSSATRGCCRPTPSRRTNGRARSTSSSGTPWRRTS